MLGQTDGRTDTRQTHRSCSSYRQCQQQIAKAIENAEIECNETIYNETNTNF